MWSVENNSANIRIYKIKLGLNVGRGVGSGVGLLAGSSVSSGAKHDDWDVIDDTV